MTRSGEIARRVFLRRAGVALALPVGASAVPLTAAEPLAQPAPRRLETLTRDDFAPQLGLTAWIQPESARPLRVRLAEALALATPSHRAMPGRAPFSLILEGPARGRLNQDTYPVTFGSLGTFALFLVPVGPPGRVARYEAVFA